MSEPVSGRRIIPWIVAIALFMETLDATILVAAIPRIAQSFHINPLELKFALTSYLLSLAIFIPVSGWVADRWGTRNVFLFALMVFTASSVWCGMSITLMELVVSRVLQGLGGAFMMPVGRLIIVRTFTKSELVSAMNFVGLPALLGPMMGPVIGGFVTTYYSWPWIFYINVPIGFVGMFFVWRYIQNNKIKDLPPLDVVGFMLFGLSLSVLFFGFETISSRFVSVRETILIILCGVIGFFLFYSRNRNRRDSILNFELFTVRTFLIAVFGSLWMRIGFSAVPFLIPLFLQIEYGMTPWESGLLIAACPAGMMLARMCHKQLLELWGFRKLLCITSVLVGVTILLLSLVDQVRVSLIVFLIFVNGFVISLQSGMSLLYYVKVSHKDKSCATSISTTVKQLGSGLGIACSALILQVFIGWGQGLRQGNEEAFHSTFLVVGLFVCLSVLLFRKLKPRDGQEVI